jgi:hypothetical protein
MPDMPAQAMRGRVITAPATPDRITGKYKLTQLRHDTTTSPVLAEKLELSFDAAKKIIWESMLLKDCCGEVIVRIDHIQDVTDLFRDRRGHLSFLCHLNGFRKNAHFDISRVEGMGILTFHENMHAMTVSLLQFSEHGQELSFEGELATGEVDSGIACWKHEWSACRAITRAEAWKARR